MHWKFDIDQRSLVRAVDDLSVKSAKIAYPDKYPLKIDFFRGPGPFSFTGSLKATVKPTNQQVNSALAVMQVPVSSANTAQGILNLATVPMRNFVKDFGERPVALELLVLNSDGGEIASWTVNCEVSRRYTGSDDIAEDLPDFKASQQDAEQGSNNFKWMTPLRVWDAIRAWALQNFTWSNLQGKPTEFPPASHEHMDPNDLKQALAVAGIELLDE
jgi:hypothetical protein